MSSCLLVCLFFYIMCSFVYTCSESASAPLSTSFFLMCFNRFIDITIGSAGANFKLQSLSTVWAALLPRLEHHGVRLWHLHPNVIFTSSVPAGLVCDKGQSNDQR